MTTYVGLFGHPVRQNLSAIMHDAAFEALGMDWKYVLRDVPPEEVGRAANQVVEEGWVGWNVTIPDKLAIVPSMKQLSPEARMIGAVNTVQATPEGLIGHNTDGAGFLLGLELENGDKVAGLRMVQIGAGGAGRALGIYSAKEGAAEIALFDRHPGRAQQLADLIAAAFPSVRARVLDWGELPDAVAAAEMVVNATPAGMWPNVDAQPSIDSAWLRPGSFVYDIINNPSRTRLLREAAERGCRVLGGLPMLVCQGALAFQLWTGREAPVAVMRRAAEKAVANWA